MASMVEGRDKITSTHGRSSSGGPLRREPMLSEVGNEKGICILGNGLSNAFNNILLHAIP